MADRSPEAHRLATKKARRERMISAQVRRAEAQVWRASGLGPMTLWQRETLRAMIRETWGA